MNAGSLLLAIICVSVASAYGPVFILDKFTATDYYYNSLTNEEQFEEIMKPISKDYVTAVVMNTTTVTLKDVETYARKYRGIVAVPHFTGELSNSSIIINTVEDLNELKKEKKTIVIEYRQGTEFEQVAPAILDNTDYHGVPMTPTVMFALITVFTLAYAFYFSVACVGEVQTPTTYTDKNLAVGREY